MKKMILMTALAGAFGYSILPSFGLRHYQSLRRRKNNEGRILYLTFDDGPSEAYTEAVLDLLDEYDIKASFFVVAEFAQKYPRIILRAKKEGHLIGIHSVNHQNALFRGNRFAFSDLAASIMTLKKLGCDAGYYRPPWGHLNLFILYWVKKMNLKLVFWDVMAQDWAADATPTSIRAKLLRRVYPGAIICLHDGRGAAGAPGRTIEALRDALPQLLREGYEFKRLDQYE